MYVRESLSSLFTQPKQVTPEKSPENLPHPGIPAQQNRVQQIKHSSLGQTYLTPQLMTYQSLSRLSGNFGTSPYNQYWQQQQKSPKLRKKKKKFMKKLQKLAQSNDTSLESLEICDNHHRTEQSPQNSNEIIHF